MAKLVYTVDEEYNREASNIELTVPDDMNIHEFKVICVRLASAMGYHSETIKKGFGDLLHGGDNAEELRQLLDDLNIGKNNR
jgi:hypothetical protein